MSEEQPSFGKRKRNPSSRLADESNDGEFILSTHRNARARAIEDGHTRHPLPLEATLANRTPNLNITSTSALGPVTPDLSRTSSTVEINKHAHRPLPLEVTLANRTPNLNIRSTSAPDLSSRTSFTLPRQNILYTRTARSVILETLFPTVSSELYYRGGRKREILVNRASLEAWCD